MTNGQQDGKGGIHWGCRPTVIAIPPTSGFFLDFLRFSARVTFVTNVCIESGYIMKPFPEGKWLFTIPHASLAIPGRQLSFSAVIKFAFVLIIFEK